MTSEPPLADRVALALTTAGHDPYTAVNFDQVTKAGWKVRAHSSGAVYVYAMLAPPTAEQQAELKAAEEKSAAAWLAISAYVGGERLTDMENMLTDYANALRAADFSVKLFDLGDARARLMVEPLPPCGQCGHTEHRHRDGHCSMCGILRMNDPRHAYVPREQTP